MNILIIEDNEALCTSLSYQLKEQNINVSIANDGNEGLLLALKNTYDVILLDRMLPIINGFSILQELRKNKVSTPIILITALGTLNDKVKGLDIGADDYLVKPFEFEELMARIRSILRRPISTFKHFEDNIIQLNNISYDYSKNILSNNKISYTLSKREGQLLELFLRNSGQILPRNMILSRIWGADSDIEDGNLDNYIYFIRRRLKQVNAKVSLVTIRGIGYKLEEIND
jgi:Response regulators consisting of a CheY-like receiver domain and a winged-helix DNA-binding domain